MTHEIDIFKSVKEEAKVRFEKPDLKFIKKIELGRENVKIRWQSESVKKSDHQDKLQFTNFLGITIPSDIELRLKEVKSDIHNLSKYDCRPVSELNKKSRYKDILSLYLTNTDIDDCFGLIYKFQCRNLAGATASIRFYFVYEVNPETKEYYQTVFLIDPFHLVIPSKLIVGKKVFSANEALVMNYRNNRENDRCLSKYFM